MFKIFRCFTKQLESAGVEVDKASRSKKMDGKGSLESRLEGYRVWVDDNRHYQDTEWRSLHGAYRTYELALHEAKNIVDKFLGEEHKQGMTADELYKKYKGEGPDPFIVPEPESKHFSAWDYALKRCGEICENPK